MKRPGRLAGMMISALTTQSSNSCLTVCCCVQLLKNLEPYIQQGLQVVQQLKAEEIQNEEGLEAQIYNYK